MKKGNQKYPTCKPRTMQTLRVEKKKKIRKHFNQQIKKIQMGTHSIKTSATKGKKIQCPSLFLFFLFLWVCLGGWGAQLRLCSFIQPYPHHLWSPDQLVLINEPALVITHEEWHDHPRTKPLPLEHNWKGFREKEEDSSLVPIAALIAQGAYVSHGCWSLPEMRIICTFFILEGHFGTNLWDGTNLAYY